MDNYKPTKKYYLGIENVHVMRDSMNKVVEALRNGDVSNAPPNQELLVKSNWLKHNATLLKGAVLTAQQVHYKFSHVVVHCSDGWDRTPQLTGLAMIMLDPYFRTIDGFIVLVEKEWLSFGHKFSSRSHVPASSKVKEFSLSQQQEMMSGELTSDFINRLGNGYGDGSGGDILSNGGRSNFLNNVTNFLPDSINKANKNTGPIFQQFLDCVYQIIRQFPNRFEYNERFLRRLLYHVYSCQYGTFLYDSEAERNKAELAKKTRSVWDYFLARRKEFVNPDYEKDEGDNNIEHSVIFPDPVNVKWWAELLGRADQEMNTSNNDLVDIPTRQSTPVVQGDGEFLNAFQSKNFNHKYESKLKVSSTPDLTKEIEEKAIRSGSDLGSPQPTTPSFPSEGFSRFKEEKSGQNEQNEERDTLSVALSTTPATPSTPATPTKLSTKPQVKSPAAAPTKSIAPPTSPPLPTYEPLGNTLVTYDQDESYQHSIQKKFDSMALDLTSTANSNSNYSAKQLAKHATALADGATTLAGDLFGRFTREATRSE